MATKPKAPRKKAAAKKPIQLPATTAQPEKIRGNANRAKPPGVINQGHTPGSASRAVVPYKAPAKSAVLKTVARGAGKALGAAAFPIRMIADSKPAGAGSDKPSGKLFSPSANRAAGKGNPKTVNPNVPKKRTMPAAGSGMSFNGIKSSPATPAPKPKAKPSSTPPRPSTKAPKPTMKPSKGPASGKMSYEAPKKPSFSGNWQGAAPSEMQARGGARRTGSGGILGAIKRKLGK